MTVLECGHKIELEKTGTAVTYCVLLLNHKGKCEPDVEIARRYGRDDGSDKNTDAH